MSGNFLTSFRPDRGKDSCFQRWMWNDPHRNLVFYLRWNKRRPLMTWGDEFTTISISVKHSVNKKIRQKQTWSRPKATISQYPKKRLQRNCQGLEWFTCRTLNFPDVRMTDGCRTNEHIVNGLILPVLNSSDTCSTKNQKCNRNTKRSCLEKVTKIFGWHVIG